MSNITWRGESPLSGVSSINNNNLSAIQGMGEAFSNANIFNKILGQRKEQEALDYDRAGTDLDREKLRQAMVGEGLEQKSTQQGIDNYDKILKSKLDNEAATRNAANQRASTSAFNLKTAMGNENRAQLGREYNASLQNRFGELKTNNPGMSNTQLMSLASASVLNESPQYAPFQKQGFESLNALNNLKTNEQQLTLDAENRFREDAREIRQEVGKEGAKEGKLISFDSKGKPTSKSIFSSGSKNNSDSAVIDAGAKKFTEGGSFWGLGEKEATFAKAQLVMDMIKNKYPALKGKALKEYFNKISNTAADEDQGSIFGGGVDDENVNQYIEADPYKG